jgi:hypothetical protein
MKATIILGGIFVIASLCLVLYGNERLNMGEQLSQIKFDPQFLTGEAREDELNRQADPVLWHAKFMKPWVAERDQWRWVAAGCLAVGLVLMAVGVDLTLKEKRKTEKQNSEH